MSFSDGQNVDGLVRRSLSKGRELLAFAFVKNKTFSLTTCNWARTERMKRKERKNFLLSACQ